MVLPLLLLLLLLVFLLLMCLLCRPRRDDDIRPQRCYIHGHADSASNRSVAVVKGLLLLVQEYRAQHFEPCTQTLHANLNVKALATVGHSLFLRPLSLGLSYITITQCKNKDL